MKVDKYYDASLAASAQEQFIITNQHVSGMVVTGLLAIAPDISITAALRDEKGVNKVLVNRITVGELAGLTEFNNDGTDHHFFIELGSLDLTDATLEVTIENLDAVNANALVFGVYELEVLPDMIVSYEKTATKNEKFNDVEALAFVHTTVGTSVAALGVNFEVKDDMDTSIVVPELALAMAAKEYALGTFLDTCGLLYQNDDGVPDTIGINVTGADAASTNLIVKRREFFEHRTSKSTVQNARRAAIKIARIERDNPGKAKALRHAGLIVKSRDINDAIRDIERR